LLRGEYEADQEPRSSRLCKHSLTPISAEVFDEHQVASGLIRLRVEDCPAIRGNGGGAMDGPLDGQDSLGFT
jgi:hypothetical protein